MTQNDSQVTVEKDLVSQAEEEDMEALLGTYACLHPCLRIYFLYGIPVFCYFDGLLFLLSHFLMELKFRFYKFCTIVYAK